MITITTKAADKVKGILEQEKENLPDGGLRIYVQGGGCSGFQYGMVLDEINESDQVIEAQGDLPDAVVAFIFEEVGSRLAEPGEHALELSAGLAPFSEQIAALIRKLLES